MRLRPKVSSSSNFVAWNLLLLDLKRCHTWKCHSSFTFTLSWERTYCVFWVDDDFPDTLRKTDIAMENPPWMKMYLLLEKVNFQPCYWRVSQGVVRCPMFPPSLDGYQVFNGETFPPFWKSQLQELMKARQDLARKTWGFRSPVDSPVEVGSSSHYFQDFIHPNGGCLGFIPSTVCLFKIKLEELKC